MLNGQFDGKCSSLLLSAASPVDSTDCCLTPAEHLVLKITGFSIKIYHGAYYGWIVNHYKYKVVSSLILYSTCYLVIKYIKIKVHSEMNKYCDII